MNVTQVNKWITLLISSVISLISIGISPCQSIELIVLLHLTRVRCDLKFTGRDQHCCFYNNAVLRTWLTFDSRTRTQLNLNHGIYPHAMFVLCFDRILGFHWLRNMYVLSARFWKHVITHTKKRANQRRLSESLDAPFFVPKSTNWLS